MQPLCLKPTPKTSDGGGHQVTDELLNTHECPVPLLGRGTCCLNWGHNLDLPHAPNETPTLWVGSTTYKLSLSVTPREEWRLHNLLEGKPDGLNSRERERERELTQQFPEVLGVRQFPVVLRLKPSTITSALALGLPDLAKPFTVYMTEKDKVSMAVLSQTMGTWDWPVAYLSNRRDSVATGWPGCLRAVAVVALLVWKATKLTLGQDLIVKVLHEVNILLQGDPH